MEAKHKDGARSEAPQKVTHSFSSLMSAEAPEPGEPSTELIINPAGTGFQKPNSKEKMNVPMSTWLVTTVLLTYF